MLPGAGLVFFPIFPAMFYMLAIALTFGLFDKFQHLTFANFGLLFFIFIISFLVDFFAGLIGAKIFGASKKAFWGGLAGSIVGLVLMPPFGAFPGIFIGVLIAELSHYRGHLNAIKAATGSLLGAFTGIIINFVLAIIFLALFIIFAWN